MPLKRERKKERARASLADFRDKQQDQGEDDTDHNTGGQGEIEFCISTLDVNIARQLTEERDTYAVMNDQSGYDKNNSSDYQNFAHDRTLI